MIRVAWPGGRGALSPRALVVEHGPFGLVWRRPFGELAAVPVVPPRGGIFPVVADRPHWRPTSWGQYRAGRSGERHHAAIDIGGGTGSPVVAPVPGIVVKIQPYYKTNAGIQTDALLLFDGAVTWLIGEIEPGSPADAEIEEGSEVAAGQQIGRVGATGHLHFGAYAGRLRAMTAGERWMLNQPPPPHLLDPRPWLESSRPIAAPLRRVELDHVVEDVIDVDAGPEELGPPQPLNHDHDHGLDVPGLDVPGLDVPGLDVPGLDVPVDDQVDDSLDAEPPDFTPVTLPTSRPAPTSRPPPTSRPSPTSRPPPSGPGLLPLLLLLGIAVAASGGDE